MLFSFSNNIFPPSVKLDSNQNFHQDSFLLPVNITTTTSESTNQITRGEKISSKQKDLNFFF